jgi:hypothetical protein
MVRLLTVTRNHILRTKSLLSYGNEWYVLHYQNAQYLYSSENSRRNA